MTPDDAAPEYDLLIPLLSLPLAFGRTLANIPASVPHLQVPPAKAELWRRRLCDHRDVRIGVAWHGSQHIAERSIPVSALEPLVTDTDFELHSLQKDISADDRTWLAQHAAGVTVYADELHDFADTAALEGWVSGRNTPQKLVWRARIVLFAADQAGVMAITRAVGMSEVTVGR